MLEITYQDEDGTFKNHRMSYILTSDYKYKIYVKGIYNLKLIYRVKDNDFVFCALKIVIAAAKEKAKCLGVTINQIIHKVLYCLQINLVITFLCLD